MYIVRTPYNIIIIIIIYACMEIIYVLCNSDDGASGENVTRRHCCWSDRLPVALRHARRGGGGVDGVVASSQV